MYSDQLTGYLCQNTKNVKTVIFSLNNLSLVSQDARYSYSVHHYNFKKTSKITSEQLPVRNIVKIKLIKGNICPAKADLSLLTNCSRCSV